MDKKFRVTVFERHSYEIEAKTRNDALDVALSGEINEFDAELDGTDVEEIL